MPIRPQDFGSEIPPPRVIASENETTILFVGDNGDQALQRVMSHSNIARIGLLASMRTAGEHKYLLNGAKIYKDVGGSIEYCTPESVGPTEATLTDFAGINIMNRLLDTARVQHGGMYRRVGTSKLLRDDYVETTDNPYRIVSKTAGFHENYLVTEHLSRELDITDTPERRLMESFLATRIIWAGAGCIGETGGFQLSQKAMGISESSINHCQTMEKRKPLYALKTADIDSKSDNFGRFEVRLADPTLSPWSRRLSFAVTSLALRLCEHPNSDQFQQLLPQCLLRPYPSITRINTDMTFGLQLETHEGKMTTALEFNRAIAEAALSLSADVRLPADELQAAHDLYTLMDDLHIAAKEGTFESMGSRIASAIRYKKLHDRHPDGVTLHNPKASGYDIIWDRIDSHKAGNASQIGLDWHKANSSAIVRNYDERIAHYMKHPPKRTRATLRVALQKEFGDSVTAVTWAKVSVANRHYRLGDPYNQPGTSHQIAA